MRSNHKIHFHKIRFFHVGALLFAISLIATDQAARAQQNIIQRVEAYINDIKHMQGDFVQQGPGDISQRGKFWLRRPWKMRFAYAPPSQSLIIADGVWLSTQSDRTAPVQRYPLGATPARFILAPNLRIRQEAKITDVIQKKGRIQIWLASRDDNLPGRIQLRFRQNPITLQGWTIIDAQGMTTKISLSNVQRGIFASNHLFFMQDSQPFKKRR